MKKSLLVLPLAALLLAGCNLIPSGGGGGKKKSTTDAPSGDVSGSGQQSTTTGGGLTTGGPTVTGTTTGGGPSVDPGPQGSAVDFDLTAGKHTAILDFEGDPDRYQYPRAEEGDTAGQAGEFGGMSWLIFHSYKGSYEGQYWLMMKDKDNWDATSNAWFANSVSLGSIESIEVVVRTGASAKKKYDLSVGASAFTSAQTGGTEFDVSAKGTYTGSGNGFFCVSTKKDSGSNKYNGQIAKITVTYTIS